MVLMLDLGRPDRVIVAATHYNWRSVFAWNVFLYSGMAGDRRGSTCGRCSSGAAPWSKPAGIAGVRSGASC